EASWLAALAALGDAGERPVRFPGDHPKSCVQSSLVRPGLVKLWMLEEERCQKMACKHSPTHKPPEGPPCVEEPAGHCRIPGPEMASSGTLPGHTV
ncbi:hypothetical protein PgNI_05652, partial [Pyricularia grisea]|uniref:Uncharacterized protein n=1 Tax=Pyricularia grisea TaxID=148305 RepID=A0A6P8B4B7_PYRGI